MSWIPLIEPADRIWLAQKWSPGLCEIQGANSPREWEERPGYGWSGSFLWFKGIRLAHFSITFRLYSEQDWIDWYKFKPLLDRPPVGKRPRALDIWHPLLVDQGIYAVQVEDMGPPIQTSDNGEWSIEVKFLESRVPKYSLTKQDGSKATPVDPWEKKIEDKQKEFEDELAKKP